MSSHDLTSPKHITERDPRLEPAEEEIATPTHVPTDVVGMFHHLQRTVGNAAINRLISQSRLKQMPQKSKRERAADPMPAIRHAAMNTVPDQQVEAGDQEKDGLEHGKAE